MTYFLSISHILVETISIVLLHVCIVLRPLSAHWACWAPSVFMLAWLSTAGVSKETGAQTGPGLVSVEARPTHYQIPAAAQGGIISSSHTYTYTHTHTHTQIPYVYSSTNKNYVFVLE